MYNTHIKTTVSVKGFVVFIEYFVTEEWAVEWWLDSEVYESEIPVRQTVVQLLNWYLRGDAEIITTQLMDEFESRQYTQEQADIAKLEQEDTPF